MRSQSMSSLRLACGFSIFAGIFLSPQVLAQHQPLTFAGSIHGLVLAEVLESGAPVDFSIPNADVKVRDASGAVVGQTSSSLAGIFASPPLPAGAYHVCASAVGFTETCTSEATTLTNASVALHQPLVLTTQGGTLHGRVTLKDGSPAARVGVAARAVQFSRADSDQSVSYPQALR
jgi:hypothetical protein